MRYHRGQTAAKKNMANLNSARQAKKYSNFDSKPLKPATLLKRDFNTNVFYMNTSKFLRTAFFYRTPTVAICAVK